MIKLEKLSDRVVSAALIALHNKDRDNFAKLVSPDATFIHNGQPENILQWADAFFFGDSEVSITALEESADGHTILATIHSSTAGELKAKMIFTISGGKVISLNAGKG